MLHEALHAKLIAEYYDMAHTTDFIKLYSYYRGWGYGNIDDNQEAEMMYQYSNNMADALRTFDFGRGIEHPISFYVEAVKYHFARNISHGVDYQPGYDEFKVISLSKNNCN